MRLFVAAASVAAAFSVGVGPTIAIAQPYYDHPVPPAQAQARYERHRYHDCRRSQRSDANKGTVAGALVGGASGALIGGNALGALVGAGVGAVGGHEIAKHRSRC